jgi:hypothetical protein
VVLFWPTGRLDGGLRLDAHAWILHVALPILRRIRHRDPEATGKIPTRGLRHAAQKIRAEPANITYDGHSLSYRNFYHAYDDLLCDASGFWTLDRTILLNYSATREVGEAFCWHLHAKGLRFENLSLGGMFNMESLERRAMALTITITLTLKPWAEP